MTILSAIFIVFSGVFFTVIIYLTLEYKQQRTLLNIQIEQLLKDQVQAGENQKDIIYRNMHDQVNPMLRSVVRNMESHRKALRKNTLAPEALEQDIDILLLALNDIRTCTHSEIPASLKETGFIGLLEK